MRTIDDVLSDARLRIRRLTPGETWEATQTGALLVDIRPAAQRAAEGEFAGALTIERNVLEWRFDPHSSARLDMVRDHDLEVIIACYEGYTSSLAAAALVDLGLWRSADIAGGFRAWQRAGLPVRHSRR